MALTDLAYALRLDLNPPVDEPAPISPTPTVGGGGGLGGAGGGRMLMSL